MSDILHPSLIMKYSLDFGSCCLSLTTRLLLPFSSQLIGLEHFIGDEEAGHPLWFCFLFDIQKKHHLTNSSGEHGGWKASLIEFAQL
jgi:hypothetical protein